MGSEFQGRKGAKSEGHVVKMMFSGLEESPGFQALELEKQGLQEGPLPRMLRDDRKSGAVTRTLAGKFKFLTFEEHNQ